MYAPVLTKHHFRVERRAPEWAHKGRSNFKIDASICPKIENDFWDDASAISQNLIRFWVLYDQRKEGRFLRPFHA